MHGAYHNVAGEQIGATVRLSQGTFDLPDIRI